MSDSTTNSLINAFNKLEHKQDWVTPYDVFKFIKDEMNFEPLTDVAATKENTKCLRYISPEKDFFKTEVYTDGFLNAPYLKGNLKKGVRGVGNFVARFYYDHIIHNIGTMTLLPTTVSSTPWFQMYYGRKLLNDFGEKAEVLFIPKRVRFTGAEGQSPPFSSFVLVHRRRTEFHLQHIRHLYKEKTDKILW